MKKTKYDEATRAAFSKAALDARNEKKPWSEVFSAAKGAGYDGTVAGIKQFLIKASDKAKGKVEAAAPAETAAAPAAEAKAKPEKKARKIRRAKVAAKAAAPKAAAKATKRTRTAYDAATTAAILAAVQEGRASGGWNEAVKGAQHAGYKGGLSGLMQFVTKQTGTTKKGKVGRPEGKASAKAKTKVKVSKGTAKAAPTAHVVSMGGFELHSLPEALRSDFSDLLRSKIEKEFKHSIKDKNVDQATAMYLDICEAQQALDAKVKALKSL